jgi:lantibiotic biosynthesis dehydratase-like protein
MTPHVFPLTEEWGLWRWVAVRAAGFPATGVELLAGDKESWACEVATDPRFAEAVVWQNRAAYHNAVLKVAGGSGEGSKWRRREELIANYWQRYCAKNDTIGFFGPLGWGRIDEQASDVAADPGPGLLAQRTVRFESWCIEALADELARDDRIRPWIAPRRRPDRSPTGTLTPEAAEVLAACDGQRLAQEIAHEHVLADLEAQELIIWRFAVPLEPYPEEALRSQLTRVGDADARAEALAALDALVAARDRVAAAAGDALRLDAALGDLEEAFTRLTGQEPTRAPGRMYGARQLVYEDCRRDLEVTIGPPLLDGLAEALPAILCGSRWFVGAVTAAVKGVLSDAVAAARHEAGGGPLPLAAVWSRVLPVLTFGKQAWDAPFPDGIRQATAGLQQRWAEVLAGDPSPAELRSRAASAFADASPAGRGAVHHSPDVQVAAPSLEAVNRGEYLLVYGDFHPGGCIMKQAFLATAHPDFEDLLAGYGRDFPPPRLFLVPPKSLPRMTNRIMFSLVAPEDVCLQATDDALMPARFTTVPLSAFHVEGDGPGASAVLDGGSFRCPLLEVFSLFTLVLGIRSYEPFPPAPHAPRLTVGRSVLRRETWRVPAAEVGFWRFGDRDRRRAAAAAWAAEAGMPRQVFVLAPPEEKPVYIDFESPVLVDVLARMMRNSAEGAAPGATVRITEMLPTPEDCWLPDAAGNRYTSELRIVCVDRTRAPG